MHSIIRSVLSILLLGLVFTGTAGADQTFIASGGTWRYLDNGSNQGTAWRGSSFDDSTWASGNAQLGYGDGDEVTTVGFGANAGAKYITTYFRKSFEVADTSQLTSLALRVLRDDGVVVYLNGTEIYRNNLPSGEITHTTLAPVAVSGTEESTSFLTASLPVGSLQTGSNVLAVEIHQQSGGSSDISFDLELKGVNPGVPSVTRGPYLQNAGPTAMTVRWRTGSVANSRVRFGTDPAALDRQMSSAALVSEHSLTLTGLAPDTRYYYAIGDSTYGDLAGGAEYSFRTSPAPGTRKAMRFWVLGDAGTGGTGQTAVRNAYYNYSATRETDLVLLLGDNAYSNGTDTEYQSRMFDVYAPLLRRVASFSTVGNHDTAGFANPDLTTTPYFSIFDHPVAGEAGGVASGTEKYYSFDYGNIHFISLDSMTSSRAVGSTMLTWLEQDLAQNTRDWLIVFFHHPPYTKGSHDSDNLSDSGGRMTEMRANVLPLLEAHGVDLVLSGHSHSYERSYLLDGHYGVSSTLTASMKLDAGDGREDGTGAYHKQDTGAAANQGAVYAVPGSAGQVGGGALNHPAMKVSLNTLGSFLVDVDGDRLDARFLTDTGATGDSFTLIKGGPVNNPPQVALTEPLAGTQFNQGASVVLAANASDSDGSVARVDFFVNGVLVGSDNTSPWSTSWVGNVVGAHTAKAVAVDDAGASTASASVAFSISGLPNGAPTALVATSPSRKRINLVWKDNSTNESGFRVQRSADGVNWTLVATVGVNVQSWSNTSGLTSGRTYHYRVRAYNAAGTSAWSNVASTVSR
jgi:hypothetical protein